MTTVFDFFQNCVQAIHKGTIIRKEVDELIVKYAFDLRSNELSTESVHNPNAGHEHVFQALRLMDGFHTPVTLRSDAISEE